MGGQNQMSSAALLELAPTGRLRVGINFGNTVLAKKDDQGFPAGLAADLATELAQRLDVTIEWITYNAAGQMTAGAKTGSWDVAFLARDPDRADEIVFTAPYLEIDSTYLVPAGSPLQTLADMDRNGVRIALSEKSAYDLFLTRHLKQAELVRAPSPTASVELFLAQKLDALAGIRPMLLEVARNLPGTRVMEERFATVQQAVGTLRGRPAAADYLRQFVEDIKASGFVEEAVQKNGVLGVSVAI
jgi:polar amino acid transport system substrate-binding protein